MDKEHDRITPDQVRRIEALCAEIDTWGAPRLRISYEMREGVWEIGISISTGRSGQSGSHCFNAQSEPLRQDGYGHKTAQEAFQKVCELAVGAAEGEMASIDKQVDELRARRLKLERAVGAFKAAAGEDDARFTLVQFHLLDGAGYSHVRPDGCLLVPVRRWTSCV